ncbi:MAG: class I SAM-dependent methyltransferase [Oscillospiraceae bacterium]|nr:class I SAM-dependent methyltransferase [Oscillospiraceae bacterium]
MRYTKDWKDYELLDCSGGERLERWGKVILIRPDPQVIWNTPKEHSMWKHADARYVRSSAGGGHWEFRRELPEFWKINYKDLTFKISPTGFKHTGLFPEQAVNWDMMREKIKAAKEEGREVRVLNLFAYTGGATLAAASAGASVCHVDAAKGMVHWARENSELSALNEKPVRWIIDDCKKFVEREIRRGSRYDAVILDPPSYGRGPGGEVWKLEEHIYELIELITGVLSEDPLFILLNSYTTGLSASTMAYVLGANMNKFGGKVTAEEIGLPVTQSGMVLPCGSSAIWMKD